MTSCTYSQSSFAAPVRSRITLPRIQMSLQQSLVVVTTAQSPTKVATRQPNNPTEAFLRNEPYDQSSLERAHFRWAPALGESLLFTGVMHAFDVTTEAGTRDTLMAIGFATTPVPCLNFVAGVTVTHSWRRTSAIPSKVRFLDSSNVRMTPDIIWSNGATVASIGSACCVPRPILLSGILNGKSDPPAKPPSEMSCCMPLQASSV